MRLERLQSTGPGADADEWATGLAFGDRAPAERPYLFLNMVATVDGHAAIDGRTAALGNEADHELFHELRTQADAVMAGASTVNIERYGRIVRDPQRREKRVREGLRADPVAVVVSGSLSLDPTVPLLQDEDSDVVVITAAEGELSGCRAEVSYLRGPGPEVDLTEALGRLRTEHGVRSVLCEGGPALNAALLREGLVDELFLCVTAKLSGGPEALSIVRGAPLPEVLDLELVWALQADQDLFLRDRLGDRARSSGDG